MNEIAMRAAEGQVSLYIDQFEKLIKQHIHAMECRDCEDFLQSGIDAFKWIQRARQNYQQSIFDGQASHNIKIENQFTQLYQNWLTPCDNAEKWIKLQIDRGFYPDNLKEFRACCEEVRDLLEQRSLAENGRISRTQSPDEDQW
jgi:hypothetical protein